jgi:hypothetical protein
MAVPRHRPDAVFVNELAAFAGSPPAASRRVTDAHDCVTQNRVWLGTRNAAVRKLGIQDLTTTVQT